MSAFRKAVKKHLDRVIDGGETLLVRRGKDEGVVVSDTSRVGFQSE